MNKNNLEKIKIGQVVSMVGSEIIPFNGTSYFGVFTGVNNYLNYSGYFEEANDNFISVNVAKKGDIYVLCDGDVKEGDALEVASNGNFKKYSSGLSVATATSASFNGKDSIKITSVAFNFDSIQLASSGGTGGATEAAASITKPATVAENTAAEDTKKASKSSNNK